MSRLKAWLVQRQLSLWLAHLGLSLKKYIILEDLFAFMINLLFIEKKNFFINKIKRKIKTFVTFDLCQIILFLKSVILCSD